MIFNSKKAFGVVIGFMFSFFIILGVFFVSFYSYQKQLSTQDDYIRSVGSGEIYKNLKSSFSINEPYFSSGRVNFEISNDADIDMEVGDEFYSCFDIFKNGYFVPKDNYVIHPEYSLSGDYTIIEAESSGILSISDVSVGDIIKVISCTGQEKDFEITNSNLNWNEQDFDKRLSFDVFGSSFSHVYDYQVKLDLNSSYLNFDDFKGDEVRFVSPYFNYLLLDLNFDNYKQNLDDDSRFSNNLTLGISSSIEASDPISFENSILFDGLDFDGSDVVRVSNFDLLENSSDFTISFWANLDNLSVGQIIFSDSNILEIELGDSNLLDSTAIRYQLFGGQNRSFSNVLGTGDWNHYVFTFSMGEGCMYMDYLSLGCYNESFDLVDGSLANLNLGSAFDGKLDEVKVFDFALNSDEVKKLNSGSLRYKNLDYFVENVDYLNEEATIWVKLPQIQQNSNVSFDMYYDGDNSLSFVDYSSIENVFSYETLRTIGYIVDQTQSNTQGLSFMSLMDSNHIRVGVDDLYLDNYDTSSLGSGVLDFADEIKSKGLAQIDGGGTGGEMIAPVSWAGFNFSFRGFRNSGDTFCIVSPFGNANVDLLENGVSFSSTVIGPAGSCITQNIGTSNNLAIESDLPVLVSYSNSAVQDPFVFYPATNEDLYGSPSQTLYVGAGSLGANGGYETSSLGSNTFALGAYGTINYGGNGADGNTPAFRIYSDSPIGAIQQADGDGSESTIFVPKSEFSTYFGANHDVSYVSVVSDVGDANCTVYDSSETLVENVATGTGSNGIYKYNFGVGNDALYVSAPWSLKCDEPVWPYMENTQYDDDETNLLGYKQMRQFVYPEPYWVLN